MKKWLHIALTAAALFAGAANASAAPSPITGMLMADWDLAHDPVIKGGAKSIEEVINYVDMPLKFKSLILLDATGEYVKRELVIEGRDNGSNETHVTDFKRNTDGTLAEVVETIKVAGKPDVVNKREKATYVKGKLTSITCERCLNKQTLELDETVIIKTAADGTTTFDIKNTKGKSMVKTTIVYDKDGRMAKATVTTGDGSGTTTVTRNAAGLIESAINNGMVYKSTLIQYEMDAKGNWTKAIDTGTMKQSNGQEMKLVREITRKITY